MSGCRATGRTLHGYAGRPPPEERPGKRCLGLVGLFNEVIDVGDGKGPYRDPALGQLGA